MYSLKERLTEILIKNKIITDAQLKKALKVQKQKGGLLKDILVNLGFASERDLMAALSQGLGIPPIALSRFKIDPEILKLVPAEAAKKYQIVPVSKVGNILTIATADPLNVFAIDDIRSLTGFEIGAIIASQKDVQDVIDQHYGGYSHAAIEELMEDMKIADLEIIRAEAEETIDSARLFKLVEEAPVVKLTNTILENGIKARSSDILIEPMEKSLRIRYRVDGVLKTIETLPKNRQESIVSRIKVMSRLNIAERRLPQDGRFKVRIKDNEVDFRVSILPSSKGEKVALRVLDKSNAMLDIEKLGFEKNNVAMFRKSASHPHGMILVCGPTGSGKTTTLYSLLKYVHSPEKNLITVEDPVEYQIQGVNQVTVRTDVGLTFASSLRSILRQDPDVIMIGEIRDFDTVDIAIKSALTGHLVFSTLHTTTACGSVVRLINMGVEPFLISASLISIVAQRLIRKLCPKCKESYKPSNAIIANLRISKDKSKNPAFYRPKGCEHCFNTGYSGRVGICEILTLSPSIKNMILKNARESEIKELSRKEGMRTLREDGLIKVLEGVTSLEEILRVTIADE
ncbi:MAG: Flp pilus assembly complex ATPase component TadA [Candidatus Omnitrophica bacterium]|nr:Flp pilus assembly complex ATPase component TadA [Candidatus Omnitrophota bacterium]